MTLKKIIAKQLTHLSLILPTTEMLIMVTQIMETTNPLKLKGLKVNRTSLLLRTSQTAQLRLLMDNKL